MSLKTRALGQAHALKGRQIKTCTDVDAQVLYIIVEA
jgi:hypothetical protein